jgi:hypothetical protein
MKRVSYLGCFLVVGAFAEACSDDDGASTEATTGPTTTATGGAGGSGGEGAAGGVGGAGGGTSAACVGFPEGAQSFAVGGETHCYWLVTTPTPQIGANDACTHGGHLATIASAAENAHVAAVAGGSIVWIGLRCDALPPASCTTDPSQYEWMTGEPVTFQNWAANEPAMPRGAAMHEDESWYGHDALQNVFPYICEAVVGG